MPSSAHPLLSLHSALAHAKTQDLPDVSYETHDWTKQPKTGPRIPMQDLPRVIKHRRPYDEEIEVTLFKQTWGSTALGYGGIGGAAMTDAYTVVAETRACACVYFGDGALAYRCVYADMSQDQVSQWMADLGSRTLASRRDAVSRYGVKLPKTRSDD